MTANPLQRFLLRAAMWLPLCFFFWWWASNLWVAPPIQLATPVLLQLWPSLFADVAQNGSTIEVATKVLVQQAAGGHGGIGQLVLTPNPMAYGYSLPLFVALVFATPLGDGHRWAQIALGASLVWLAQGFGLVAETLKLAGFDSGAEGLRAVVQAGLNREWIALCYQFGYLILPAVIPAALWLGLNRRFIETLVERPGTEPASGNAGPSVIPERKS